MHYFTPGFKHSIFFSFLEELHLARLIHLSKIYQNIQWLSISEHEPKALCCTHVLSI